jgi:two-component system response regulator HydG
MPDTLLLVSHEPAALQSLYRVLKRDGRTVLTAASATDALHSLESEPVAVAILDLCGVDSDRLDLLRRAKRSHAATAWLVLVDAGCVARAVAAMQAGAADVLVRPCDRSGLETAVSAAIARQRAGRDVPSGAPATAASPLLGTSAAMAALQELIARVGPSAATILIQGESGTGKDVVAVALQQQSKRRDAPFVKVNCAAIPEALMESELFGHERGAFTGAVRAKKGKFELADGGTIFLDEIGDMSPTLQMKLLRVLQEGEFDRVGGTRTLRVDVRVIAATNVDLERAVAEKRFREDLYYRLRVIEIALPPLRARRDDIPLLAEHFLRRYAARNDKSLTGFEPAAMAALLDQPWQGNVRELENAIERAVVLATGPLVRRADLAPEMQCAAPAQTIAFTLGTTLDEIERRMIAETLRTTQGDKTRAASMLGITARTIYRKLERRRRVLDGDLEPLGPEIVEAAPAGEGHDADASPAATGMPPDDPIAAAPDRGAAA